MCFPKDGQINANHYTKALLQSIIQRDVHRYYQTEVKHIHHNNGFYTVTTNNANIIDLTVLWNIYG
jgi:glycine oxidase